MNLPTIFKNNKKTDSNENELVPVTISIPDIKQHLVNEFKKAEELEERIKFLTKLCEQAEVTKIKYEATLVTLDEYKKRIDKKEADYSLLEDKIATLKIEKAKVHDEVNTLTIVLNDLGRTKEEIENKLHTEYEIELAKKTNFILDSISNQITSKKGNLSKGFINSIISSNYIKLDEEGIKCQIQTKKGIIG